MSRSTLLFSSLVLFAAALLLAGCGAGKTTPTGGKHSDPEIEKNLAQLSAEDRALAEGQGVCPVSEKPLGEMGKPKKLVVKGQTVFLCCAGCEAEILGDPDTFLAKLKK